MDPRVEFITPDMAADMLARNTKNRPINSKRVDDLKREMESGHFVFNGDTIRIDADGVLLDGQHRLTACVQANRGFKAVVVRGLPRSVMPTIDQHSKRTIGQVLSLAGVPNANHVAAVTRIVAGIATGSRRNIRLSTSDVMEAIDRHPLILDSASVSKNAFPKTSAVIGALHYIGVFLGRDDDAGRFLGVWRTGVPSYPGCPVHTLRERLLRDTTLSPTDRIKGAVMAWERFVARDVAKIAKIPADPSVRGWSEAEWLGIGPTQKDET